jgi:hypothetical protein
MCKPFHGPCVKEIRKLCGVEQSSFPNLFFFRPIWTMTAVTTKRGDLKGGNEILRGRGKITMDRQQKSPRLNLIVRWCPFQSAANGSLKFGKPEAKSSPVL